MSLALLAGAGAWAQGTATIVVRDAADARDGAPDLKRVAATRLPGASVRVAISLAGPLVVRDLLADAQQGGPPGSICVRLWTTGTPRTTKPGLLVCVTAQPDGRTLRSTISREVPGALPRTVGTATLERPSETSLALRIPAGLFGRARRVSFAAESTLAGCVRLSCVDLAPDDGATRTLRLR